MQRRITAIVTVCPLIAFAILLLTPFCLAAEQGRAKGDMTDKTVTQEDQTGTDPRGFAPKFMPYYRYTELENNLVVQEMTLFGMYAFTPRFAMTYEWPIAKYLDATDVSGFPSGQDGTPGDPGTGAPGAGFSSGTAEDDGDAIGMGDLNLRFFFKPEELEWGYDSSKLTGSIMFGSEILFPTATENVLGNESLILSPMLVIVHDTPTHGFFAMMNFYDFTAFKDRRRDKVKQYRGRWFLMQPLTKPGPWYGGIYLLPEFQPVYNFEGSNSFSFWFGPELGKIIKPGVIVYAKPGWGVSPTATEREFTFEFGWRWFF